MQRKLAGSHARLVVHARSSLMGSILSLELVRKSQGPNCSATGRVSPMARLVVLVAALLQVLLPQQALPLPQTRARHPLALVQGMERMEQAKRQSNFNCRAVWCMFLHAFAHRCSFFETFTI
ncbi:hypothetical protein F5879DRAFT_1005561 [Lentinula edodes]|nr:hypothetical protein F5879DRAFT_1005561 [Lentinula edodes]